MEVINPFLQDNKQRIIAFLDEISVSCFIMLIILIILCGMFLGHRSSLLTNIVSLAAVT